MARYGPLAVVCWLCLSSHGSAQELQPLQYNHPGLVVDLGVGLWAWPLPMDFDGDGDLDLVVSCPDKPYNGTYFFENPGGGKMPVFKPAVRIGPGYQNLRVSHVDGVPRVLAPGTEFVDFLSRRFEQPRKFPLPVNLHTPGRKIRMNAWSLVDFDADGRLDVIAGVDDWADYGWDDGYDASGKWLRGPLRGYVYLVRNEGTNVQPKYANPRWWMQAPNQASLDRLKAELLADRSKSSAGPPPTLPISTAMAIWTWCAESFWTASRTLRTSARAPRRAMRQGESCSMKASRCAWICR